MCVYVCTLQTVKAFLPQMKAHYHGHIMILASVLSLFSTARVEVNQQGVNITASGSNYLTQFSTRVYDLCNKLKWLSHKQQPEKLLEISISYYILYLKRLCKYVLMCVLFDRITVPASLLQWVSTSLWHELLVKEVEGVQTTLLCPYIVDTGMFEGCKMLYVNKKITC